MTMIIKESEIRKLVRECISRGINEARNVKSKKLFDILQQHGGFENSQRQFPDSWKLSDKEAHFRRKPSSGNYSNLTDNDIIGVISSEQLRQTDLNSFAEEQGINVPYGDNVSKAKLSDGSYLLYIDRNSEGFDTQMERNPNKKDGDWHSYWKKKEKREHDRNSDGKNEFKPTTDVQSASRDLIQNPYFRNKEGAWSDSDRRRQAIDNAKQGLAANGGPVWRYYNGKAENDRMMNEAMMNGFSFESMKGKSFAWKVKYCKQMCGNQIGGGSSRLVFQIDDQWVLKLGKNGKGVAQNEEEFRIATDGYGTELSVHVDENRSDIDGYEWIVSEYVLPAKAQDFQKVYGVEWEDVQQFAYNIKNGGQIINRIYTEYENNDKAIELFNEIHDYWANLDGAMGDVSRICNWGLTNRDGAPQLVLLDLGASQNIIRE